MQANFQYLEYDIQETYDGELVVFHDTNNILRTLPKIGINFSVANLLEEKINKEKRFDHYKKYEDFTIQDLKLSELKLLILDKSVNERVPTLKEFLKAIAKFQLKKPMAVEVKIINSDSAKFELISLLKDFKNNYMDKINIIRERYFNFPFQKVGLISLPWFAKKSFSTEFSRWCAVVKGHELSGIYLPAIHYLDLCLLNRI